ncbi:EAL domain-containing protein [Micromonospora sp. NPDC049679]|uniref:EAL domain-containing protein n=1 Tax=Micromonospora sp. NPDC049679 TaxID=3155920 RepID=UPI0033DBEFCD
MTGLVLLFVAVMRGSTEAEAVVRSTIELARTLGLEAVAEGVETSQQRRTLWELGCGTAQGHGIAPPHTGPCAMSPDQWPSGRTSQLGAVAADH